MGRIVIELNNRCNLRCRHCPDGRHGGNGELSATVFDKILRMGKALGFNEFAFTGGEPTLYKQFHEIIAKTAEAGYDFGFVTNGWNFSRVYRQLLPYRARLQGLSFSMDGAVEATHDALRGKGSYRRLMQAISICVVKDIPFTINMVLSRQNCSEVEAMVKSAASLGSRGIRFGQLMPTENSAKHDLECSFQTRKAVEARIFALQKAAAIPVVVAPGYHTTDLFPCAPLQMRELNIDWRGNVSQCCHLSGRGQSGEQSDIVGNLEEIDFAAALLRLEGQNISFREQKQAHHGSRNWSDADYFPCLYCLRNFGKFINRGGKGAGISVSFHDDVKYSNNLVLTGAEPPDGVNARRTQGMARVLAKDCNAAVTPLGGSRRARR